MVVVLDLDLVVLVKVVGVEYENNFAAVVSTSVVPLTAPLSVKSD